MGLPTVDYILQEVSAEKLDKKKYPRARNLCVDLLGEDGLKARAGFLKLNKRGIRRVCVFLNNRGSKA